MKYALALLALLPSAAFARQDDPYKNLAPGDRVMITFRSGGTLSGVLIILPPGGRPLVKPGGLSPFQLLYFRSDSADCKTQDGILDEWKKKHPEGRFDEIAQNSRPDLWQAHNVSSTPTLVLKDPATSGVIRAAGVHSAEQLQDLLDQIRGGEGSKVDYTKETHLTIDMSLEYPGLNGTMTLPKRDIKEIRQLQKLDAATEQRLREEKAKVRQELEAQNETRRKAEAERDAKAREALEANEKEEKDKAAAANELKAAVEKAERIQKGMDLLKRFPPGAWGPDKLKEIANKSLTRVPVTEDERIFSQVYDQWVEARKFQEEQQKKKEEKPPEK